MKRRKKNSPERYLSLLRTGAKTPDWLRKQLRQVEEELDDARHFNRDNVASLEREVADLTAAVHQAESSFVPPARERLDLRGREIKADEDEGRIRSATERQFQDQLAGKFRPLEFYLPPAAPKASIVRGDRLEWIRRRLTVLDHDLKEAMRFRDSAEEVERIKSEIKALELERDKLRQSNPKLSTSRGKLLLDGRPLAAGADISDNLIAVGPFGKQAEFFGYHSGTYIVYVMTDDDTKAAMRQAIREADFPLFPLRVPPQGPGALEMFLRNKTAKNVAAAAQYIVDGDDLIVTHMVVRPKFRRMGLNTHLIDAIRSSHPQKRLLFHKPTRDGRAFMKSYGHGEEYRKNPDHESFVEVMEADGFEAMDSGWSRGRIIDRLPEGARMELPIDLLKEGYLSEEDVAATLMKFPAAKFYGVHVGDPDEWLGTLSMDGYLGSAPVAYQIHGRGWSEDAAPFWEIEDPNKRYEDLSPSSSIIFTIVNEVPDDMLSLEKEFSSDDIASAEREEEARRAAYGIGGDGPLDDDDESVDEEEVEEYRRNMDEDTRDVERRAASGDMDAVTALLTHRMRSGALHVPEEGEISTTTIPDILGRTNGVTITLVHYNAQSDQGRYRVLSSRDQEIESTRDRVFRAARRRAAGEGEEDTHPREPLIFIRASVTDGQIHPFYSLVSPNSGMRWYQYFAQETLRISQADPQEVARFGTQAVNQLFVKMAREHDRIAAGCEMIGVEDPRAPGAYEAAVAFVRKGAEADVAHYENWQKEHPDLVGRDKWNDRYAEHRHRQWMNWQEALLLVAPPSSTTMTMSPPNAAGCGVAYAAAHHLVNSIERIRGARVLRGVSEFSSPFVSDGWFANQNIDFISSRARRGEIRLEIRFLTLMGHDVATAPSLAEAIPPGGQFTFWVNQYMTTETTRRLIDQIVPIIRRDFPTAKIRIGEANALGEAAVHDI